MSLIRRFCIGVSFLLVGVITAPTNFLQVQAHQQKAAITKILFNPRTNNIEVMHRFVLHDAEHAVRHIFGGSADIISDVETQAKFAAYVRDRFGLIDSEGNELPLAPIGFETERGYFWVYDETPIKPEMGALSIRHNALRDLWPEQINTVNVEGLDEIKTATFEGSVELLTVDLH